MVSKVLLIICFKIVLYALVISDNCASFVGTQCIADIPNDDEAGCATFVGNICLDSISPTKINNANKINDAVSSDAVNQKTRNGDDSVQVNNNDNDNKRYDHQLIPDRHENDYNGIRDNNIYKMVNDQRDSRSDDENNSKSSSGRSGRRRFNNRF